MAAGKAARNRRFQPVKVQSSSVSLGSAQDSTVWQQGAKFTCLPPAAVTDAVHWQALAPPIRTVIQRLSDDGPRALYLEKSRCPDPRGVCGQDPTSPNQGMTAVT